MRMNFVGKTLAAVTLAAALIAAPMTALAEDGNGSGSGAGGQSASEINIESGRGGGWWNPGQTTGPDVFGARPAGKFGVVGGAAGTAPLTYHGGLAPMGGGANVGVVKGTPKVYLVFWGSQWGTDTQISATIGTRTVDTFSGDPKGVAPYLQDMLAGLGTSGDNWSGVVTEYCDQVATGASFCASQDTSNRAGYPASTGILAGVWYDSSTNNSEATSATAASQTALEAEAIKASVHFGNGDQPSNMSTQYVIVSPTGTHPNGFNYTTTGWCAWHFSTSDARTGNIAFTNLPYMPDMGSSCGANFINAGAAGTLDGVSIVEGHELAETQTDQWPAGATWGYTDSKGAENGDKCSWTNPADSRNGGNLVLTTGTFAMQGTWSNLNGWCSMGSNLQPASNLVARTGSTVYGRLATGGVLPYTITGSGLPAGLSLGNDGRITGNAPATAATYSLNYSVTDATGANVSVTGTLTVAAVLPTSVNLTTTANSVSPATSVTLTASVSPQLASATVNFYDGTALLGSAKTSTTGTATLAKTFAAGTHSITASVVATTTYSASTSSAVSIVSQVAATATNLSVANLSPNTTTSIPLTATVSITSTGNLLGGVSVTFYDGTTSLGSATTSSTTGIATLSKAFATAGQHSITAKYAGNTSYGASTSAATVVTSSLTGTSIPTLTTSTATTRVNTAVTLTATMSPKVTGLSVVFKDSLGVTLGTATTASTGVATLKYTWTTATPAGYSFYATFAGNTTYGASTSANVSQTVK